jgi:hypothetical protein
MRPLHKFTAAFFSRILEEKVFDLPFYLENLVLFLTQRVKLLGLTIASLEVCINSFG